MRLPFSATAVTRPLPAGRQSPWDAEVAASTEAGPPRGRWLLWTGVVLALVALLVLTPPLVNANRYRGKIAESMSKSLGRPVHLDNVSLHVLPVPGFTLQNLVVSEDPEFGAEPTIRANTVEATLRVSSLWHRPVEFSTVRFVEPSVNLVRNPAGRWNLSEVLLHASRVESAPTTQGRAGPAPRFPYIEATGGRVNIKLGPEKLPYSLTDADFALWLPSARQWRVRLQGHPARTDTDITDPGTMRVEGDFQRAPTAMAVPVNLRASWHDAPLGEATRILTGTDWGWRGLLNVDATLAGTLGDARLNAKTTLGGLRRAEFFPARPLDLQITCGSAFALHPATLTAMHCSVPDDGPQPLSVDAATVHLQGIGSTTATLRGQAIPMRWAVLWAGLFSPRVPPEPQLGGTVDLDLQRAPAVAPAITIRQRRSEAAGSSGGGWIGTASLLLPQPAGSSDLGASGPVNILVWQATSTPESAGWPTLRLAPTSITLGPSAALMLAGDVGEQGYSLSVNGNAPPAALLAPARYLPQLGDGLDAVLGDVRADADGPLRWQFTCARSWTLPQTCSTPPTPPATARERPGSRRARHDARRLHAR